MDSHNGGIASVEAHLQQIQATLGLWWDKLKFSIEDEETETPEDYVILGQKFSSSTLDSPDVARAIHSTPWFTYRSGFEPIARAEDGPGPLNFAKLMIFNVNPNTTIGGIFNNQSYSTDVGWGCMIRTSQSLLACALLKLLNSQTKTVLSKFSDTYDHPFSIHNFVRVASELPLRVKPGEWFGPSAASLSIKRLCEAQETSDLNVFISEGGDLCTEDIEVEFARGLPVLVLCPVRLGIDRVNDYYQSSLFQLLSLSQSVGIAGGEPRSSYFFFGHAGSKLLYLDPHNLQPVSRDPETYRTSAGRMLGILGLDPSMVIGFLVNDREDYKQLQKATEGNKIIHFHEKRSRRLSPSMDSSKDDFIEVGSSENALVDDFVDVGDELVDEDLPKDSPVTCHQESSTEAFQKYDFVERPTADE